LSYLSRTTFYSFSLPHVFKASVLSHGINKDANFKEHTQLSGFIKCPKKNKTAGENVVMKEEKNGSNENYLKVVLNWKKHY